MWLDGDWIPLAQMDFPWISCDWVYQIKWRTEVEMKNLMCLWPSNFEGVYNPHVLRRGCLQARKWWMPWTLSSTSPCTPVSRESNASEHFIFQAGVNNRRVSVMLWSLISSKYLNRMSIFAPHSSMIVFCACPEKMNMQPAFCMGGSRRNLVWIHDKFGHKCMRKENCWMLSEDFHFAQVFMLWPSPWYSIAIHFVACIVALTSLIRVTLAYLYSSSHRGITIFM